MSTYRFYMPSCVLTGPGLSLIHIYLTCIEDEAKRARAEKIVILAAKDFILNREDYDCGKKYIDTIHKVAASL